MRLIVGGYGQGKLNYALSETKLSQHEVTNGRDCPLKADQLGQVRVFYALEQWFRRQLAEGISPFEEAKKLIEKWPQAVLIAQEIGSGVVPLHAEERRWREETGRTCCMLAQQAARVDRVFCGLAATIKGE